MGFTHISFMSQMAQGQLLALVRGELLSSSSCWHKCGSQWLGCQDRADMKTFCCVLLWSTASKKHIAGLQPKADCSAEVRGFPLVSSTLNGLVFRRGLPEARVI